MKLFLRSFLPLLLGLLASCTVYEKVFHPYRLPTPNMTAEAKAKFKAAEKARHKGTVLKTEEITTNATDTDAPGGRPTKADNKLTYKELPAGTQVKYDRELLLKKPKLKRRQYHHYETRPLKPRQASRENRRLRKHSKGKGKGADPARTSSKASDTAPPDEGVPNPKAAPTPPKAAPEPKAPKVKDIKEPKVKEPKTKKPKAPIPKPDPTQEQPGN